ncbi:hypothetical protein NPIL_421811 [Nephila pilipes]|uniref:Uncharacterized protein n=1 Tax=Nephila pilipes TaxID=299642 RepID=A0A8X6TUZ8_NEPPI|nr:hypothetical protein NPIL_421811 [Nephila pilipes]
MLNDSQNEMEFRDDSRSSFSSISISSIDTSSTCERKKQIESKIQTYTRIRQDTKLELAQNFSIHNDYEHPEYKSLKNSIKLFNEELRKFLPLLLTNMLPKVPFDPLMRMSYLAAQYLRFWIVLSSNQCRFDLLSN